MIMTEQKKQTLSEYKKMYEESETLQEKAFFGNGINYIEERYGLDKTHFEEVHKAKQNNTQKKGRKPDKGYVQVKGELKKMIDYIYKQAPTERIAMILIGYPKTNTNSYRVKNLQKRFVSIVEKNYNAIKSGELDPNSFSKEGKYADDIEHTRKLMQALVDYYGSLSKAAKKVGIPVPTFKHNINKHRPSKENAKKIEKVAKRLDIDIA